MSKTRLNELQALVVKLQADREAHVNAIAEIDATFKGLGMAAPKKKRRGRKPGRPKKKMVARKGKKRVAKKKVGERTKRRKFKTTANELVISTIRKAGAKGATGAQISKAWKVAKRPGDAYNTLGILVKEKKIKRQKMKGGKGSVYRLA